MCLGTTKLGCFSLHNWVFLFYFLYVHACYAQKERYAKKNKSKKNQNVFKYDCKRVSRRCGSYMMYLEGDSPHQIVMIVCECIRFSHISNRHNMRNLCTLVMFSHTTHKNSLLCLIHVQVKCDLAITSFRCVNVCSLNCLNLVFEI